MALEYPDVMNDITDARSRFESDAIQYLAEFADDATPAGQVVELALTLQSIMDFPVQVAVHLDLPRLRGKLRRLPQPFFAIYQLDIGLTLENGEVAQLVIPVRAESHVPPGEYAFTISVHSKVTQQTLRVRPERADDRVGDINIRHPQGLGIAQIASWGFESKKAQEQEVSLTVVEGQEPPQDIDLKPRFTTLWTPEAWELIPNARREANERRAYNISELTAEALYLAFMRETEASLSNIGIELYVGEAIFLAKILTYTVTYLMGKGEWQDCLLVPIYAYARAHGQDTADVVWLVTGLGYSHVLELAIALSFGLVEDALGKQIWDRTVQRALREFIVGCLDGQTVLPAEFLYLPLVLGGMAIAKEVMLGEENVQESLRLLARAKAEKADVFADEELREVNDAFDRLLARYARG